jgi:hypothetical protein
MYRGRSIVASEPNGIMFAATLVPSTNSAQNVAQRKTAKRTEELGYLVKMASRRSQGFHSSRPQEWLMAEVARIPREAFMVTLMGLAISCDHTEAYLYLAQRLKSG